MIKIVITGSNVEEGLTASLSKAFLKHDCEVVCFDDALSYTNAHRWMRNPITDRLLYKFFPKKVQEDFIEIALREKPDVLLVLKGFYFHPKTIARVKSELPHTFLFYFNPDNTFNTWHFGNSNTWILRSIPCYNVHLIWGLFLVEQMKKYGAKRIEYFPFGYDAELHYPINPGQEEKNMYVAEIAFVGTWDKEREWWLNQIIDYPFSIWGNSWERANKKLRTKWKRRAVFGNELSKVCNSSKINLNFIRRQNIPAHNMRTFELPACKVFMLTTRTEEQNQFFEEGRDFACFSTPEELREKLDYYLPRDELRREMAENAYKKVQGYTYFERVKKILALYAEMKDGMRLKPFNTPTLFPSQP